MGNKLVWVIVVVLVLAGLYYWSMPAATPAVETAPAAVADAVPAAPEDAAAAPAADASAPAPVQ